ncbi:winged helix-turn-helix transcriptional regulator [Fusibacter bizertensis]|jgi:Transcriptional regulators|uniref:Winged helix-turn-helix transcriptional regulator n=1 Tax=Fusibacter bizertensis TaxID=1488331 RepID=A0ABT6NBX6_9FIRM|nr:winged helix DNA-binding protein [Fusibacter bizertensis]MDH8677922.1 winged helix-turn-helix transcriptional regulator [Fusibacter bizertensis]
MKDNNHKIKSILKQVMIFNDFYEEVIQSSIVKNQDSAVSKLEFKLLHTVFRHERLMISEVSEILNISLPNCSRYVKTAIEDGYIQKQIDLEDKRIYYISLTEKGKNIVAATLESFGEEMSNQLLDLDFKTLEKLDQSFSNLNNLLSETLFTSSKNN